MTQLKSVVPRRTSGVRISAGAGALAALLLLASIGQVVALPRGHDRGDGDHDRRGGDFRGDRGRGGWGGGYYRAPPVVYGSPYYTPYATPYYNPPPVVYGPGIGVVLPEVRVRIR